MAAPDIASLLQHLTGPPAGAPVAQGPPPGPPQGPQGGGSPAEGPALQVLKQMIQLAHQYMQVEPDQEDKATMAKVLMMLQQYLAKDQADQDNMMGGAMQPRLLRKVAGNMGPQGP